MLIHTHRNITRVGLFTTNSIPKLWCGADRNTIHV